MDAFWHLVIEGGALIELADESSLELKPGDVAFFPHGDAHHNEQ
jgi:mannose-6-phosphate isomerase-like protein (cupin superfamily)